jgi:hypothetical protein
MAKDQVVSVYQANHMEHYISVWERYGQWWEGGNPSEPIEIKSNTKLYNREPGNFRLAVFIGNDSLNHTIKAGTNVVVSIMRENVPFKLSLPIGGCRLMDSTTFHCKIDEEIPPRGKRTKRFREGPEAYLMVAGPVGKYKVQYVIDGQTTNGCHFTKSGDYFVSIVNSLGSR